MSDLNWVIVKDHFEAKTEFGTYELGDWGSGKGHLMIRANGSVIIDNWEACKTAAQTDYDARKDGVK